LFGFRRYPKEYLHNCTPFVHKEQKDAWEFFHGLKYLHVIYSLTGDAGINKRFGKFLPVIQSFHLFLAM
jgi:hypothetical protein